MVFKSTGLDSRFQRKNRFWKICTGSRDIGQNMSTFAGLVWKSDFGHFFGNILGLRTYFSKHLEAGRNADGGLWSLSDAITQMVFVRSDDNCSSDVDFFLVGFVGVEFHRSKFIWKKEGLHSSGKLNSLNHLRIKLRICKENVCVWVKQLIQRRKQTIEKKDQKPYFLWHEDDKGLEGGQRWYDNWNLLDMILMRCKILWLDIWVVTGHSCQFNLVDKSNLTLIFDTQKTIGVQKMLVQNNYPPRNILDQKTFLLIKIKIMTPKILGK